MPSWVEDMTIIEMLIDYNVPAYMDHLDKWRRDYYNQIIERYFYPFEPKGDGYLKLLQGYPKENSKTQNKN